MDTTNLPGNSAQALASLRAEIDGIDLRLVELLSQRIGIVKRVGEIKKAQATQVRDHNRESMQMRRLLELSREMKAPPAFITLVFRVIIEASVRIQQGEAVQTEQRTRRCIACNFNTSAALLDPDLHWPICPVCSQPLL